VRYFDIRLGAKNEDSDLWVCHGMFSVPFTRVVEDIAAFYASGRVGYHGASVDFDLEENKEIIIVDVQKCEGHNGPNGEAINDGFFKMLEPIKSLCMTPASDLGHPIGQLQRAGVRVIVLYPNGDACNKHNNLAVHRTTIAIDSQWKNKNTVEDIKPLLIEELKETREEHQKDGGANLHVLQAVLTSDTELIVKGLLLPDFAAPDSVEVLASKVNDDAMEVWVGLAGTDDSKEEALKTGEPGAAPVLDGRNILMLDFNERGTFEGLDAVQLSHFLNVRKFGAPEHPPRLVKRKPGVPAAFANFPEAADLLGDKLKLFAPDGNQRVLTVWGGDGAPVRVSDEAGTDNDIWSWYLVAVGEEHVALRSCSGSFLRLTEEGAVEMCIDRVVPENAKFTLHKAGEPVEADGKKKFEMLLKPAASPEKALCVCDGTLGLGDASVSLVAYDKIEAAE